MLIKGCPHILLKLVTKHRNMNIRDIDIIVDLRSGEDAGSMTLWRIQLGRADMQDNTTLAMI